MPKIVSSEFEEFLRDMEVAPERIRELESTFLSSAARSVVVRSRELATAEGSVMALSKSEVKYAGVGQVKYGGMPYNMGAEFGSKRYRQFQPWRGKGDDAGYFFWPAIREFRENSTRLWLKDVWNMASSLSVESGQAYKEQPRVVKRAARKLGITRSGALKVHFEAEAIGAKRGVVKPSKTDSYEPGL